MESKFLLSNKFKIPGWLLVISGFILTIIRFRYGIKPSFLDVKVFAFYSSFIETKYFSVVENHFSEEIAGCLLILGFLLIVFSKEKEENDRVSQLRNESLTLGVLINSLFMILGMLFFFGFAYIEVMLFNVISLFVIYICVFKWKIYYSIRKTQL